MVKQGRQCHSPPHSCQCWHLHPVLTLASPPPAHPLLQLDDGLWEVCLQDYGIYRNSAICGTYLTV